MPPGEKAKTHSFREEVAGLFDFYEFDAGGTVRYCRAAFPMRENISARELLIGRNFLTEVLPYRNRAKLEDKFQAFVSSRLSTDSFIFGCREEDGKNLIELRIGLVRVAENRRPDEETGKAGERTLYYLDIKTN